MGELTAVILAAGKGTRMKSKLPKVLHKVGGRPMLEHVMEAAEAAGCRDNVVIVGHGAELVRELVGNRARIALQAEQLGTGHAVLQAAEALKGFVGTVMILCGDTPLIKGGELKKLYEFHVQSGAVATVMTAMIEDPFGYGRILRDADGNVAGIVEEKEASPEQKLIKEINTGNYCVEAPLLFEVLKTIGRKDGQGSLLVIHGEDDEYVPLQDAKKNYALAGVADKKMYVMPGDDHHLNLCFNVAGELVKRWIAKERYSWGASYWPSSSEDEGEGGQNMQRVDGIFSQIEEIAWDFCCKMPDKVSTAEYLQNVQKVAELYGSAKEAKAFAVPENTKPVEEYLENILQKLIQLSIL